MELETFKKKLGLRLRELRLSKNMKQEQLEEFGFSYRYYGRMERGLVNPTAETLLRLCDIFNVPLVSLVSFMESAPPSDDAEAVAVMVAEVLNDEKKTRKLKVFLSEVL